MVVTVFFSWEFSFARQYSSADSHLQVLSLSIFMDDGRARILSERKHRMMTLSGGKPREGDSFTLLVLLWTSRMRVGIRALGIHDWTSDVHTDDCSLSTFRYSTREPCDRV
ncbi:hypothetical protein PDE_02473 [Penicillium oxalicum 114-2]|uniref:Uncharacterized protein n=1 Tax=Penicillium oxalicum (strain 114-2 / CGMCC 5302) TaxID=933388 RepID=S7ZAA9_PENO1|nr:hypothetical protein PDE_02473 [Penicillium oxalicum 114-2]